MTDEPQLFGALKHLVTELTQERRLYRPPVRVTYTETPQALPMYYGVVTRCKLELMSTYTVMTDGNQADAARHLRRNAILSLGCKLYEEPIAALQTLMQTIGDGNTHAAMQQCSGLIDHLRGTSG